MKLSLSHIESSWRNALSQKLRQSSFDKIVTYLNQESKDQKVFFPSIDQVFRAFELTPLDKVSVVILGQDPYHRPGQAMGLSFSVPYGVTIPPSLRNIYKELSNDIGAVIPDHGNLTSWAEQGVLLLNAILTVRQNSPGSHKAIGWQQFTDEVIRIISSQRRHIIFLLWGKFAQSKSSLINHHHHHILTAAHPSPLARGAFNGCGHFSKTNLLLREMGKSVINWQI